MKQKFLYTILFFCCLCSCHAQYKGDNESELLQVKLASLRFCKSDKRVIINDTAVVSFYEKLRKLKEERRGKVNIVHMGDSHIQAGYFVGLLRRMFQRSYGNGGRGVMFPYRIAKSNGPYDYVSGTTATWTYRRNVFADSSFTTGLAGFAIECDTTDVRLYLTLRNNEGVNYDYNHIQVFTDPAQSLSISVYDSTMKVQATQNNTTSRSGMTQFDFDTTINSVCIRLTATDTMTKIRVTGVNTFNDSAGIILHTIGVNGAKYEHFNRQPLFFEQLNELHADLIILSFGTNEAYTTTVWSEEKFLANVDSAVKLIKGIYPGVPVLITTPAESGIKLRRRRVKPHPNMYKVQQALLHYCHQNNIACFDLYTAAGGPGSFLQWRKLKMMDANVIHFTREAYELQALMMWQALTKNTASNHDN